MSRPQIAGEEREAFKARLKSLLTVEPGAALGTIAPPVTSAHAEAEREIDRLAPKKVG